MNNKSFFAKPGSLLFVATVAGILAIGSVCLCFLDDFAHSLVLFFDYILLFILMNMVTKSFLKGEKETVKAGAAAIYTLTFLVFVRTFVDIIYLNSYYLFTENYIATLIGVVTILIFLLFTGSYIYHFAINKTSTPNTRYVEKNKVYLIIICILCFVNAVLIYCNDLQIGRRTEWFLIITYCMYAFVALALACIETLINNFRIARESGNLETYATKLVGKEAAARSVGKKVKTTSGTKTKKIKKTTKK